ncbi:hypothetical protein VTL71DRAFT_16415 [Oculimacula yallundae]|uniref:Ankyrin n=1 Tax=Oculimacula yallundae TaxID=86028 RepID=A0ABR4CED7_9HELO
MVMVAPTQSLTAPASSLEEADSRIRKICVHGYESSGMMREAIDADFLPYANQILALPQTKCFEGNRPHDSVVAWALGCKCYPLLRYLIRHGWDMNRTVSYGPCPFLLGDRCALEDVNLTRFLLDHGADPTIGETPRPNPLMAIRESKGELLHWASIYASLETFKLLQSRGANLTYAHALHGAAWAGFSRVPIIRHLLDTEAVNVDELDIYTRPQSGTPLLTAIRKGNVELVKLFLDYGAHPLACIVVPYITDAMQLAKGLMDEDASKEILKMLEEAKEEREKEGRLGNVPTTDMGRPDYRQRIWDATNKTATLGSGGNS